MADSKTENDKSKVQRSIDDIPKTGRAQFAPTAAKPIREDADGQGPLTILHEG